MVCRMSRSRRLACLALWIAVVSSAAMPQPELEAQQPNPGTAPEPRELVLFPFDDFSIPFTYGLTYNLVQGHREGVVLRPADSGPDSQHIINHGSVLRVGDEFRMWYLCTGDQDTTVFLESEPDGESNVRSYALGSSTQLSAGIFRVCYAVSRDGINWERPALGLVKYGADTQNNLVDLPLGEHRIVNVVVIDDPADPVPDRRFKMAIQSIKYQSRVAVAFSPDGLRWKESPLNPVTKNATEIHGLTKFDGAYYVNGHGGSPRASRGRRMVTYMSYDFEHWTEATALSFERKGERFRCHGGGTPVNRFIPAPACGTGETSSSASTACGMGTPVTIAVWSRWIWVSSSATTPFTSKSRFPTSKSSPPMRKVKSSPTPTSGDWGKRAVAHCSVSR